MTSETVQTADQTKITDIAALSWEGLVNDVRVPSTMKAQILLQLQQAGQRGTFIKIVDFGRLSTNEEIERKRKATEDILNGKALFEDMKRAFLNILDEEKLLISREIDNINDMINTLNNKKGYEETVHELREYRDELRGYDVMLDWFKDTARKSTSVDRLKDVMRLFGSTAKTIYDNRDKIYMTLAVASRAIGGFAQLAGQGLGQAGRMVLSFV